MTLDAIQYFGFFSILAFTSYLIIRLIQAVINGRRAQLSYGLEAFLLLSLGYYLAFPSLELVKLSQFSADIKNIIALLWWINFAFIVDTSLNIFIWDGIYSDHGKRHIPKIVSAGITLTLYTIAITIVLHFFFDKPITALLATSGAAALIIGFSAQSTLKEIFSGLALNLTKVIRLGDFIEIDGIYGEVFEISWRSVSLKNPHTDSLYIFPNSLAAGKSILNFSEPDGRFKYYVTFVTEASAPPEKVIRSIAQELKYSRYVRRDPKPDFNVLGFTEHGLEIRVRFFFDGDDPWWDAQNEVCMAIWAAMRKNNFRLGIKRYHLNSGFEWLTLQNDINERYSEDKVRSYILNNNTFKNLTNELVDSLVKKSSLIDLNPPSCFYHIDDTSDFCYLLLEGQVSIYKSHNNTEVCIEECNVGELFGLTGIVENNKRVHMAQALQYTIALKIDASELRSILEATYAFKQHLFCTIDNRHTIRANNFEQELGLIQSRFLDKNKNLLTREIKKSIDHVLTKPWHYHFKNHISSTASHDVFLTALMAALVLIDENKTTKNKITEKQIKQHFKSYNLLKHINIHHAFKLFNQLKDTNTRSLLMDKIKLVDDLKSQSHLIVALCYGIGCHDDSAIIEEIKDTLLINHDIEGVIQSVSDIRK